MVLFKTLSRSSKHYYPMKSIYRVSHYLTEQQQHLFNTTFQDNLGKLISECLHFEFYWS